MKTIKELNNMGIEELTELCTLYAIGIGVGNDMTIKGVYPIREGMR